MLSVEEKTSLKEAFSEVAGRLGELESGMTEAAGAIKTIQAAGRYGRETMAASVRGGEYLGFWRDDGQAREFGQIVAKWAREKTATGAEGEAGGYLLPTDMATWLIDKLAKYGKFRADAMPVTMGTRKMLIPILSEDLKVYCPGEGRDITSSDIAVGQTELDARTFCALTAVSGELDEDSLVGIGDIIGMSIARAMAKKEDEIGFAGDGSETYFGMTGITGALRGVDGTIGNIKGLHVGTGNAYAELTLEDFENVVALLPSEADDGDTKWYMSRKFYWSVVHPLAVDAGVADLFSILSPQKAKYLLGYECVFPHCMPSVEANSQICAILGNLKIGAYLGQRKSIEIATSNERYFESFRRAIRGIERIDIDVHGVGDTTEAGPIVGLITAAA